jgi:hypothetical protein
MMLRRGVELQFAVREVLRFAKVRTTRKAKEESMEEIGPVDYALIAFPGNQFRGEIGPALADLVDAGTIRIIDAAFVAKDENGNVLAFELRLAPMQRPRSTSKSRACSTRTT